MGQFMHKSVWIRSAEIIREYVKCYFFLDIQFVVSHNHLTYKIWEGVKQKILSPER